MTEPGTRDRILWMALFAGPLFWLMSFLAKFAWVPKACTSQTNLVLLLFAFVALFLTGIAGVLAWRQWSELGKQEAGEGGDSLTRSRFMAVGAIVFSVSFGGVIIAQTVPDLILRVCQ